MNANERKAWLEKISVGDLESRMAAIGQAQANANLVKKMFKSHPLKKGARLLIAGCGTGQLFDYASPNDLGKNIEITLTDINQSYLSKAEERLSGFSGIKYSTARDDIENTRLNQSYDAVLAVLVLLHVEWKKALASMLRLNPRRLYIIEQEQDASKPAVGGSVMLKGGWLWYAENVPVKLIPRNELINYLHDKGYDAKIYQKEVPDNKKMVGFVFEKN